MVKPESIFASYQLIPLRFLFFCVFLSALLNLPGVTNQNTQISEDRTHPARGQIRVPEHLRALGGRLELRLVALPQPTPLSPAPSAGILTAAPVQGGAGGSAPIHRSHTPTPCKVLVLLACLQMHKSPNRHPDLFWGEARSPSLFLLPLSDLSQFSSSPLKA